MGESRRTALAVASRHDPPKSSVLFDVAIVEQGSLFYRNREPIPQRSTWAGKSVVALGEAVLRLFAIHFRKVLIDFIIEKYSIRSKISCIRNSYSITKFFRKVLNRSINSRH